MMCINMCILMSTKCNFVKITKFLLKELPFLCCMFVFVCIILCIYIFFFVINIAKG